MEGKDKDGSAASEPSSAAPSPRTNKLATSSAISPLKTDDDNDNDGGEECPKCTVCKKRLGRRNCIKQACVSCCDDPACEPHREAREAFRRRQSVLDGTDRITRAAARKRASRVAPGAFFDADIHYFGDTVLVWNVGDFARNGRWREEAVRRSRKRRDNRDFARGAAKRRREGDGVDGEGEGKANDGVGDGKQGEDVRAKKKKPLTRKKRFDAICEALYRKSLCQN